MGYGKVNFWVKNEDCEIINRAGHLHIYDCHGTQVYPTTWFQGGHIEIKLPPGCYVANAGVVWGNVYTEKVMFQVCCEKTICVTLLMNRFKESKLLRHGEDNGNDVVIQRKLPMQGGCTARLIAPFIYNATLRGMDKNEISFFVNGLMQVAEIPDPDMHDALRNEINLLATNMENLPYYERMNVQEYIHAIEMYLVEPTPL